MRRCQLRNLIRFDANLIPTDPSMPFQENRTRRCFPICTAVSVLVSVGIEYPCVSVRFPAGNKKIEVLQTRGLAASCVLVRFAASLKKAL